MKENSMEKVFNQLESGAFNTNVSKKDVWVYAVEEVEVVDHKFVLNEENVKTISIVYNEEIVNFEKSGNVITIPAIKQGKVSCHFQKLLHGANVVEVCGIQNKSNLKKENEIMKEKHSIREISNLNIFSKDGNHLTTLDGVQQIIFKTKDEDKSYMYIKNGLKDAYLLQAIQNNNDTDIAETKIYKILGTTKMKNNISQLEETFIIKINAIPINPSTCEFKNDDLWSPDDAVFKVVPMVTMTLF